MRFGKYDVRQNAGVSTRDGQLSGKGLLRYGATNPSKGVFPVDDPLSICAESIRRAHLRNPAGRPDIIRKRRGATMHDPIDRLFRAFDDGRLSRRDLLRALGLAALAVPAAAFAQGGAGRPDSAAAGRGRGNRAPGDTTHAPAPFESKVIGSQTLAWSATAAVKAASASGRSTSVVSNRISKTIARGPCRSR